MVKLQKGRG